MKFSSLTLLILFCAFVSSTETHAQPRRFLSAQVKNWDKISPSNRVASFDQLYQFKLLGEITPDDRLLYLITLGNYPEYQQLLFPILKANFDLPESVGDLTNKQIIALYLRKSPYLIDTATHIFEAKDLDAEMIIRLLEELYNLGIETNRVCREPLFWRTLSERYRSIGRRMKGTSIQILFTYESIYKIIFSAAIAQYPQILANLE